MKTTIEISLKMALKAYDAITDNRNLEENVINEFPNVWIIEAANPQKQIDLVEEFIYQLADFGILLGEYKVENQ